MPAGVAASPAPPPQREQCEQVLDHAKKDIYMCPKCHFLQNQKNTGIDLLFRMKCDRCKKRSHWGAALKNVLVDFRTIMDKDHACAKTDMAWEGFSANRPICSGCKCPHTDWNAGSFGRYLSWAGTDEERDARAKHDAAVRIQALTRGYRVRNQASVVKGGGKIYVCGTCNHCQNEQWTGVDILFRMECLSCGAKGGWKEVHELDITCNWCSCVSSRVPWNHFVAAAPPTCQKCNRPHGDWTEATFAQYISAPGSGGVRSTVTWRGMAPGATTSKRNSRNVVSALDPEKDIIVCPHCHHLQNPGWTGFDLKMRTKCDACGEKGHFDKAQSLVIQCSHCQGSSMQPWVKFDAYRPPYCDRCGKPHGDWSAQSFSRYLSAVRSPVDAHVRLADRPRVVGLPLADVQLGHGNDMLSCPHCKMQQHVASNLAGQDADQQLQRCQNPNCRKETLLTEWLGPAGEAQALPVGPLGQHSGIRKVSVVKNVQYMKCPKCHHIQEDKWTGVDLFFRAKCDHCNHRAGKGSWEIVQAPLVTCPNCGHSQHKKWTGVDPLFRMKCDHCHTKPWSWNEMPLRAASPRGPRRAPVVFRDIPGDPADSGLPDPLPPQPFVDDEMSDDDEFGRNAARSLAPFFSARQRRRCGLLRVEVLKARGLPMTDQPVRCEVQVGGGAPQRTRKVPADRAPHWNDRLHFDIRLPTERVSISVVGGWRSGPVSALGVASLAVNVDQGDGRWERWLPLRQQSHGYGRPCEPALLVAWAVKVSPLLCHGPPHPAPGYAPGTYPAAAAGYAPAPGAAAGWGAGGGRRLRADDDVGAAVAAAEAYIAAKTAEMDENDVTIARLRRRLDRRRRGDERLAAGGGYAPAPSAAHSYHSYHHSHAPSSRFISDAGPPEIGWRGSFAAVDASAAACGWQQHPPDGWGHHSGVSVHPPDGWGHHPDYPAGWGHHPAEWHGPPPSQWGDVHPPPDGPPPFAAPVEVRAPPPGPFAPPPAGRRYAAAGARGAAAAPPFAAAPRAGFAAAPPGVSPPRARRPATPWW